MLPFVRMFYGSPSEYLWEDNEGNVHSIPQGEGGEQGDAMMLLLFCLGQQEALQAGQRQLQAGERLLEEVLRCSPAFASTTGRRRFGTSPVSSGV